MALVLLRHIVSSVPMDSSSREKLSPLFLLTVMLLNFGLMFFTETRLLLTM